MMNRVIAPSIGYYVNPIMRAGKGGRSIYLTERCATENGSDVVFSYSSHYQHPFDPLD
jgi:hypothetical protein